MTWLQWLENLPIAVAMLAVLVWAIKQNTKSTISTIETISKTIVQPIKDGLEKSMEAIQSEMRVHRQRDLEDSLEDREDRRASREAFTAMTTEFQRLCLKLNGIDKPDD